MVMSQAIDYLLSVTARKKVDPEPVFIALISPLWDKKSSHVFYPCLVCPCCKHQYGSGWGVSLDAGNSTPYYILSLLPFFPQTHSFDLLMWVVKKTIKGISSLSIRILPQAYVDIK